ncbi:MAG: cysteine hydrolase family protein [Pseudomonadota bacterium]
MIELVAGAAPPTFPRGATALLIIDVQKAFHERDARGDRRSNPAGEANIAKLLAAARAGGWPVIHVHHHSKDPASLFHPSKPGAVVQDAVAPADGERVYKKHENSAFIATSLEADLRDAGITTLIACGATANHCVETTTRMGGNLGFAMVYVGDAVWAYDVIGPDGRAHRADDVHSVTLANLEGEFAQVVATQSVLRALERA